MTFNMGTRGLESAVDLVEYRNYPGGTRLSDLRRSHGYEEPRNIRYWCLGNEVDGEWQIAQRRAEDYGWLCRQTAKAVKRMDPSYQLIAAGSSSCAMPAYIDWDLRILDDAYEYIDGLAIHCYTDRKETDTTLHYLAHTISLEQYTMEDAMAHTKNPGASSINDSPRPEAPPPKGGFLGMYPQTESQP
jgi:alpha-N-arabinofuranosidase